MNYMPVLEAQIRLETTTCDRCGTLFGVPIWMENREFFCPRGHRNEPRSFGAPDRQVHSSQDPSEVADQVDVRLNSGPIYSAQIRQVDSGCGEYHGVAVVDLGGLGELTLGIAIPSVGPSASLTTDYASPVPADD